MAEAALGIRSPLTGLPDGAGEGGEPGVTISEQAGARIIALLARRGTVAALVERCRGFGIVLPVTPRRVVGRDHVVLWTGPGQWQVQAVAGEAERLLGLFASLSALCSTVVLDDSRIVLSVGGPRAREALAKVLTLDLHPRAFQPGEAAVTVAGGMSVVVSRREEQDVFDCAVPRSFALDFWTWLAASAAEYGVATATVKTP